MSSGPVSTTTDFVREFELEDWRVRPQLNQFELGDRVVRVEGRAMAVLVELAQRAGTVCSKRRLMRAVWGDAFVTDDVLTHAVWELRKALGDDSRKPRYIATIPRKGYRLIAPVSWGSPEQGSGADFHYQLFERIGSGGMGIVYRALDTRLNRTVALKFLPPGLTGDPKAKARLMREAQAAAALDHPNIAVVFDVGEDPKGQTFIAMGHYQGETLKEKISRGRLSMTEVASYGRQIADGLLAAHEAGIVHRDIKPANIIVTGEDRVKIVDFGLAKPFEEAGPTLTQPGVTPGTVLYMSPERLRGEAVDHRSDLWSLGTVLYEMVTGVCPFRGDSTESAMLAVLGAELTPPRVERLETPAELNALISRLLQKDPELRIDSAQAVVERLTSVIADSASDSDNGVPHLWHIQREWILRWRRLMTTVSENRYQLMGWVLLGALGLVSLLWQRSEGNRPAEQVIAFDLSPPSDVAFAEGADSSAAISPDGKLVAFVGTDSQGRRGIWTRSLDGSEIRRLPGTERSGQPFWAPDGQSVGFLARGKLRVVSLSGGPPRELAPITSEARGASWGTGGLILFAPGKQGGLYLVSEREGSVMQLTTPDRSRRELGHMWPQFLPDGKRFIYFVPSSDDDVRGIYLASLDDAVGQRLLQSYASGTYANGFLLHLTDANLLARPFDLESLSFVGNSLPIADGVASFFTYQGVVSASTNGVLIFSRRATTEPTDLRWADATGATIQEVSPVREYRNPSLSRDGRYLAAESHSGTDSDIVVLEVETGRLRQITDSGTQAMFPLLSPDGETLVFAIERSGGTDIHRLQPNGITASEIILSSDLDVLPADWSADGKVILLEERTARGDYDILELPVGETVEPARLLSESYNESSSRFSPTGSYLSYISNESGRFEVYIEPYPRTGLKCQASNEGGYDPQWGKSDRDIYYLSPAGILMSVANKMEGSCDLSKPFVVFDPRVEPPPSSRNHYQIDLNRNRFLLNSTLAGTSFGQIGVIVNWPTLTRQVESIGRPQRGADS